MKHNRDKFIAGFKRLLLEQPELFADGFEVEQVEALDKLYEQSLEPGLECPWEYELRKDRVKA